MTRAPSQEQEPAKRTFVRMFRPEWIRPVHAGEKRQTIRPYPTRVPVVGDYLDARCWKDKPMRSKHCMLGIFQLENVFPVTLERVPSNELLHDLATRDGFPSWDALLDWFIGMHGDSIFPFHGIVLRWKYPALKSFKHPLATHLS